MPHFTFLRPWLAAAALALTALTHLLPVTAQAQTVATTGAQV